MQGIWKQLNDYASKKEIIQIISEKICVPPAATFLIVVFFAFILVIKGIGNLIIILFFSLVFPGYQSFKSLKAKDYESVKNWAKFWTVIGLLVCFYEIFQGMINEIPFIGILKPLIAYLLVRSQGSFAVGIYNNYITPLYESYESFIDSKLEVTEAPKENKKPAEDSKIKEVGSLINEAAAGEKPKNE